MRRPAIRLPARLAAAGTALVLLGGCSALPRAHEIQRTTVMQTLGVDVGTAGLDSVAVTASSEGRPPAGESGGEEPVVLTAQGDTVSAACAQMESFGRADVFYGDVEQVLIGQGQAQRGLNSLLDYMAMDQELRLEAQLWVVKEASAADALFVGAEGGGPAARLHALENDSHLYAHTQVRSARSALADLLDGGCTYLPALGLEASRPGGGTEGKRELVRAGYALFRGGALCGWAEDQAARGLELLLGRGRGEVLEFTAPDQTRVALEVTGVRVRLAPVFERDRLRGLEVDCRLEARVIERRGEGGPDRRDRAWLTDALSREARERVTEAWNLLRSLDADVLDLGKRAALAAPWRKAALAAQWEESFSGLELSLRTSSILSQE